MTVEKLRLIVEELPPELYSKVRSAKSAATTCVW